MASTKKPAALPPSPGDQRAATLEYLILLNNGLSNALDALEIARDSAATPADRQKAENNIPAIVQAKALVKAKTLALIKGTAGSAINPPSAETINQTMSLSEGLGKVDSRTTQLQSLLSMTAKIVNLANSI